jgi:hypothetical protein
MWLTQLAVFFSILTCLLSNPEDEAPSQKIVLITVTTMRTSNLNVSLCDEIRVHRKYQRPLITITTLQRRMNANNDGYLFMLMWHNEMNKSDLHYCIYSIELM